LWPSVPMVTHKSRSCWSRSTPTHGLHLCSARFLSAEFLS
jgi:hypothetical protein